MVTVSEVIKNSSEVIFDFYRQGHLYYNVHVKDVNADITAFGVREVKYTFPVEIADLGTATLNLQEKPIIMMRYIRKALEAGTFVKAAK